ncbi:aspartic proteinase NANA, chloroplast-like [Salvia splendens]|nr:aspartic proteinase NANA, chloroplast-like [Salvia splendens]
MGRPRCMPQQLLFILFLIANSFNADAAGVKFELIHRHHLHPGGALPLRKLVHSDASRSQAMSRKVRSKFNASGELPLHSAADYGVGQYLVKLKMGTPGQHLVLIPDTGSDLTWTKCRYKCHGDDCGRIKTGHRSRVFHADRSSSFKTVPCSSTTCQTDLVDLFSLAICPSPLDPCAYDYSYVDGTSAQGIFAHETLTFSLTNGRTASLRNVLVGCSESSTGRSLLGADGIMGLGYSTNSNAVHAAGAFGGKFSYCLVDHLSPRSVSSHLIFGSYKDANVSVAWMRHTELVLGAIGTLYAVRVRGISVGGAMLDIPAEVWDFGRGGGAMLDSGTTLTVLTTPAYEPVMAALRGSLRGSQRVYEGEVGPLEYCFNSTGFDERVVPRFMLHFVDGARFEPPVKSYVIDDTPEVKCLGFADGGAGPGASIVGNIMQQNHLWEFDFGNRRLGFGPSSCA